MGPTMTIWNDADGTIVHLPHPDCRRSDPHGMASCGRFRRKDPMTKADELATPDSCLNRSQDHEPLFVLCARDRLAPDVVEEWADRAEVGGVVNAEKIAGARRIAHGMRIWQAEHGSKIPD